MSGMVLSYVLASVVSMASLVFDWAKGVRLALIALAAGLFFHVVVIGQRWIAGGRAPLATLYDVLLVLAAGIVLLSAAALYRLKLPVVGLFAGVGALLLLGYASTLDAELLPLAPVLRSNQLFFHVSSYLVGYAGCAVAFGTSVAYLVVGRRSVSLAAALERLTHGFVLFAFPFLTAGMSSGMVWAENAWGRYWGWDPKESWALIAWLLYGYLVHMRLLRNWGGRRTAWLSVAGFAAILFTLFGVNVFLEGLHSYR